MTLNGAPGSPGQLAQSGQALLATGATAGPPTASQPPAVPGVNGQPTATTLVTTHNIAPSLDPVDQVGIASLGPSADTVTYGRAIEGYSQATNLANTLKDQSDSTQAAVWARLGPSEQRMIQSAGYKPLQSWQTEGGIGGFFSHALHDVVGAADVARHIGAGTEHYALDTMAAPNVIIRAANTLLTARRTAAEALGGSGNWADDIASGRLSALPAGIWGPGLKPADWANAWHATKTGQTNFDPQVVRGLSRQFSPTQLKVLQDIAAGLQPQDVVSQFSLAVQPQIQDMLASPTPAMQVAVAQLQNSRPSLGHFVVGEQNLGTPAGQDVSALVDGTFDWYATMAPFNALGKAGKAEEMARYGIHTADDIRTIYEAEPSVQRAMGSIADALRTGGAQGVLEKFPRLGPAIDDLVKADPTTGAEVRDWMAGTTGMRALAEGRAGMYYRNAQLLGIMPHLSALGDAALDGKVAMQHLIDWAADSPKEIIAKLAPEGSRSGQIVQSLENIPMATIQRAGSIARRLSTLTPIGLTIDPTSADSTVMFQRLVRTFLPAARANDLTNLWAEGAGNLGTRRLLLRGAIDEIFHAAGLDLTDAGQKYMTEFFADHSGDFDQATTQHNYSINGIDILPLAEGERHANDTAAILTSQMNQEWSIPQFRDVYDLSKKSMAMRAMNAGLNADWESYAMEHIWKPSVLLRFGFALRAGGDELANAIFRNGITWYIRTHAARTAMMGSNQGFRDIVEAEQYHPLTAIFRMLTDHMPDEWVGSMRNGKDLVTGYLADNYRRSFSDLYRQAVGRIAEPIAGERLLDAYSRLYDKGVLDGAFAHLVSAAHGNYGGDLENAKDLAYLTRKGYGGEAIEWEPSGAFIKVQKGDRQYVFMHRYMLDGLATSPEARVAMEAGGEELRRKRMVDAVEDLLKSDGYEKWRLKAIRANVLRDGRRVGVDATSDEALHDWANTIVDHTTALLRKPTGGATRLEDGRSVRQFLLDERIGPPIDKLQAIEGQLPLEATGRDMVPVAPHRWDKFIGRNFYHLVSRPMDWMSRQPMFVHNYANSYDGAMAMLRASFPDAPDEMLSDEAHEIAVERAVRETVPFIHNPKVRSQMAIVGRNFAPFFFAQEQFWKRWSRVLRYAPESFREAQLTMNGLRAVGFLHTDQNGQGYFNYPAIGFGQQFVRETLGRLYGAENVFVAVEPGLSGQVQFIAPGLDQVAPSVGPLVSIPLTALAYAFPALVRTRNDIVGPLAGPEPSSFPDVIAGSAQQSVPTVLSRLFQAIAAYYAPEHSASMMNNEIAAAQYLETTGHGLPANYTTTQFSVWQDQVRNWATNLLVLQAFVGTIVPASPQIEVDPLGLKADYTALLNTMPYEQAVAEYIKLHPDGVPYTVSGTTTEGGAFIPATKNALNFLDANKGFMEAHPNAGVWLMPLVTTEGPFSDAAYQTELATALRTRKDFPTWYADVKFTEVANTYYDVDTAIQDQILANPGQKDELTNWWDGWSAAVKAANPIFAERADGEASHAERVQVIADMQSALSDPNLPLSATVSAVAQLQEGYNQVQQFADETAGYTSYSTQRTAMKDAYIAWATAFVQANPLAAPYWQGTLSLEVPG